MDSERAELGELIEKLHGLQYSEAEEPAVYTRIGLLSPHPYWSDYVFQTDNYLLADGRLDIHDCWTRSSVTDQSS